MTNSLLTYMNLNFKKALSIFLVFHAINLFSQTTIPVNTSLRDTLTKSASLYYVKGNVFVAKNGSENALLFWLKSIQLMGRSSSTKTKNKTLTASKEDLLKEN